MLKRYNIIRKLTRIFAGAIVAVAVLSAGGCSGPRNLAYFQDSDRHALRLPSDASIRIEPGDKISIVVKSRDPKLSEMFNLPVTTNRLGQMSGVSVGEGISGYTVDKKGDIDFPVIGSMKIAGMTRGELAAFIKGELMGRGLVKDPVVTVEYLNATFSVLGEVNNPGRFDMQKDEVSILEALALAGDLTIQGKRENVVVARTESDTVNTYVVDLTDLRGLTASPAYYLKQGDVIYVEPNDVRKRQATVNGNNLLSWGFWVSVASLLTSIAVLIVK